MKIIIATDSFKGSLTAIEAAEAMAEGIHEVDPSIQTTLLPIADGGEGTMRSLVSATAGRMISAVVEDPLGRNVEAFYGVLGDEETAVIELAEASGLLLLSDEERNPLFTSTFGTGQLIAHALDAGFRKFIIGLGGSATNDGGVGLLQALRMQFVDQNGNELIRGGEALRHLHNIETTKFDKRIAESTFLIASDVENELVGQRGASFIFGPQKGATSEMVQLLDENLTTLADLIVKKFAISLHNKRGAGAAGGAGGAFQAFFPGETKRGIDVVLEAVSFDEHLQEANLVLTGEGKSDAQTLFGKAPYGIAKLARKFGKPVILISGTISMENQQSLTPLFTSCHAITDETITTEASMKHTYAYLRAKTAEVMKNELVE